MANSDKMKILIVDDEAAILFTLKDILKGHTIFEFTDAFLAIESIKKGNKYDILIVDFRLQALSGLDILFEARKYLTNYRAILLTAHSNAELLEQSINNKLVSKVINKPFEDESFLKEVNIEIANLQKEINDNKYVSDLKNTVESFMFSSSLKSCDQIMIHKSQLMKDVLSLAMKYASSSKNANIVITGENGVGKEIFGNIIHKNSSRSDKPFIKINCSAIPESLFEAELFGYEKGAYTGAINKKAGKFKLADGGSIFLDEIGEIPLNLQAKLLRVIETKEFSPLGSSETLTSDVRVICATNVDLQEKISNGSFREDLFFRLNVLNIHVPALRDRKEDISVLASYFIYNIGMDEGGPSKTFNQEALDYLSTLEFRGNVRELKNLVHRIYLSSDKSEITVEEIKASTNYPMKSKDIIMFEKTIDFGEFRNSMDKQYLETQFAKFGHNIKKTAEQIGMKPPNLHRKMKELGIN